MVAGWLHIPANAAIARWAEAARPLARKALAASPEPLRCGGTWAVGLDLLPNAADGSIGGVALPWAELGLAPVRLHPAQVSAVYPGYPQPSTEESEAAFRFRKLRDAAHLDGLLPIGPDRRRMIREAHGWILGLPLEGCSPEASPLVVWEGSHLILRDALRAALAPYPATLWDQIDITEAYQAARAEVFRRCRRVEVSALPGEATILHRHLLHGVAPWKSGKDARVIAYFRPLLGSVESWLSDDIGPLGADQPLLA